MQVVLCLEERDVDGAQLDEFVRQTRCGRMTRGQRVGGLIALLEGRSVKVPHFIAPETLATQGRCSVTS